MLLTPEVRIFDRDGVRQPLPEAMLQAWQFELLERGGYGSGSLAYTAELDERLVRVLPQPGWRIDILFNNVYAYRAWVEKTRPPIAEDPAYRVEAVGMMGRLDGILADCQHAHPGGIDVAGVFAWLAATKLTGDERIEQRGLWSTVIESEIGYRMESASLFGRSVREAFDALAAAAVDKLIWGWDVSSDGSNRLYVRQRPTTVTDDRLRFRIGKDISYLELPEDTSELCNAVKFRGGPSKVPNLAYNPSWELPQQPGETASGSLLTFASFESGATDWIRSAGATIETSDGNPGTYARTANHWLKLSGSGEAEQTIDRAPDPGSPFAIELYYAAVQPGSVTLNITVEELDSGGSPIGGPTTLDESITTEARSYQKFRRVFATQHAGTAKLRVTISRTGGGVAAMVDDVYLYDASFVVQDGWRGLTHGNGEGTVDWANQEDPWHGSYCLRVETTHCDGTNANTFRLRPTADHWISCRRKTAHVVRLMMRTTAARDFRLGITVRNSNRVTTLWDPIQTTNTTGNWTMYESRIGTGAGERFLPVIEFQGNGTFYLDGLYIFEDEIIADSADVTWYLDGEEISSHWRACTRRTDLAVHASNNEKVKSDAVPFSPSDVGLTLIVTAGTGWTPGNYPITAFDGEYVTLSSSPAATTTTGGTGDVAVTSEVSSGARDSIETYGLWERILEVDEIEDWDQARRYAAGYFNRFAIPQKRGSLVIDAATVHARYVDTDGEATPMGMVAMDGARDAIESQFPTRILYSGGKGNKVTCEFELTNRRPDPGLLLARALSNNRNSSGGGGGGGGAGNGQGGGDVGDEDITGDLVVKEGGSTVSSTIGTIDFGVGFDVSESPSGEANVSLDLTEQTWPGPFAVNGVVSVFSQSNAVAFLVREASGQTQPLVALQNNSGISLITFLPSSAQISVIHPSTGGGQYQAEGYGGLPSFVGRRSAGSRTSPTATASGNPLVRFQGTGYTGSAFATASGDLEFQAAELFSSTNRGTRAIVRTTPLASTTAAEVLRVDPSGGVNVGGVADNVATALLQLDSTSRGFLPPRWTTAQRDAISSPASGLQGYDTDLASPTVFGTRWRWTPGVLYNQTADKTVANTTTETSLIGTGVGSVTLPANYFKAGKSLVHRLWGYISETGTPNGRLRVYLGATLLLDTTAFALPAGLSNHLWEVCIEITCRTAGASGTVYAQAVLYVGGVRRDIVSTATVTVDTTASKVYDVTWTWGTADPANTLTSTNGIPMSAP